MRKKGEQTGGTLAPQGKEFSCKIEDTLAEIKRQNPNLTDDEVQNVFEITREQIIKLDETEFTAED